MHEKCFLGARFQDDNHYIRLAGGVNDYRPEIWRDRARVYDYHPEKWANHQFTRGCDQSIQPAFLAGSNEPIGKNFIF